MPDTEEKIMNADGRFFDEMVAELGAAQAPTRDGSLIEAFDSQPSGPMTVEQINAEFDAATQFLNSRIPQRSPVTLYSFGFEAEDLLTVYAALRTYLRTAAGQESEDLEALARIVKLLSDIRPSAVKASKSLSLAVERESVI